MAADCLRTNDLQFDETALNDCILRAKLDNVDARRNGCHLGIKAMGTRIQRNIPFNGPYQPLLKIIDRQGSKHICMISLERIANVDPCKANEVCATGDAVDDTALGIVSDVEDVGGAAPAEIAVNAEVLPYCLLESDA